MRQDSPASDGKAVHTDLTDLASIHSCRHCHTAVVVAVAVVAMTAETGRLGQSRCGCVPSRSNSRFAGGCRRGCRSCCWGYRGCCRSVMRIAGLGRRRPFCRSVHLLRRAPVYYNNAAAFRPAYWDKTAAVAAAVAVGGGKGCSDSSHQQTQISNGGAIK